MRINIRNDRLGSQRLFKPKEKLTTPFVTSITVHHSSFWKDLESKVRRVISTSPKLKLVTLQLSSDTRPSKRSGPKVSWWKRTDRKIE